jgi:hypothetical protein
MTLQTILKSQYHASLAMLREAIQACPPGLWASDQYVNPFWRVAYHALFYTHLYLQPSHTAFVPWEHHRPEVNRLGANPDGASPAPYALVEIAAYCQICEDMVDAAVDALDLAAPESGFPWYRMSKLEHQLVNLRHLQHHVGQLTDRLRQAANRGVRWVGGGTAG